MFEGLKMSATWIGTELWGGSRADKWRVTISRNGQRMQVPFTQGSAFEGAPPTVDDVLDSLVRDAMAGSEDFEEFCSDFGYDEDSRSAFKTWRECQSIADRLSRILESDEYERIVENDQETMDALKAIPTKNN